MSQLTDYDRKAFEAYILAKTDEERQEAIKKLIPGSPLYYNLYFIDRFKKVGSKLTEDDQTLYKQFSAKYKQTSEFKEIETMMKLLEYDAAETQEEKANVLNQINQKFLNLNFHHSKPDDIDGFEDEEVKSDEENQINDLTSSADSARDNKRNRGDYGSEEMESEEEQLGDEEAEPLSRSDQDDSDQDRDSRRINIRPAQRVLTPEQHRIRNDSYGSVERQHQHSNSYNEEVENESFPYQAQQQTNVFNYQEQQIEQIEGQELLPIEIDINRGPAVQMNDRRNVRNLSDFGEDSPRQIRQPPKQIDHRPVKNTSVLDFEKYFGKEKIRKLFSGSKKYDKAYEQLRKLPKGFEHKIDFNKFNPKAVYYWGTTEKFERIADLENETFYQSIAKCFNQTFKEDKHFKIQQEFINKLTLKQLDKLATLHLKIKDDENFIGSYFQKHFHEELSQENQEIMTLEEKRANLLMLYNYTKSKNMPKTLQSTLLLEILDIGIQIGIYDEDLFKEYLQMPQFYVKTVFKTEKKAQNSSHWNQYIRNVQKETRQSGINNQDQEDFIVKYLEYFCQRDGNLEKFKEEFDTDYLKKIEERIAIYNSDDMTILNIDLKKYQQIQQEVIIRFLESNKDKFTVQEEVQLSLELKNVQTLFIKIFEFNTETYYKKTLEPFRTDINLDGLIASIEKQYEYKNPANKKFTESFTFEELKGKIGLFIVEFIGNGKSSRAVIKKGQLSLIHRPTIAGHLAYILDENKQICVGPKTGVFFDSQYYPSQEDQNGKIFIPYGKYALSSKVIMLHNGFAQLGEFERKTETYDFSAWIHVNSESILIGNKASIIIKPTLQINKRETSLDILKNTKITLQTFNYIDSIPITKTYENVKFKDDQEYILDFQVPPYLSNINVTVEAEVFSVTQSTNQKFTKSKEFKIRTHNNSFHFAELYLRKENGKYFLYLLGKNGEPQIKQKVKVGLIHKYLKRGDEQIKLITDKDGKVELGQLKGIFGIMASSGPNDIETFFMITENNTHLTYPDNLDIIENESIEFPVLFKKKSRKNIQLIKKNGSMVLEDLFDKIEFVKQDEKDFNLIRINNLSDGKYKLFIKQTNTKISINVNKGQYWENNKFILKRNCLFENRAPLKMVKISTLNGIYFLISHINIVQQDNNSEQSTVNLKLEDFSNKARVHAFAVQYLPNMSIQMFLSLFSKVSQSFSKVTFPFAMWKNILLSNRELADEFRYVFDRRYAERFLGNTLERPRLALKRTFIQATTLAREVLKGGTAYAGKKQEIQGKAKMMKIKMAKKVDKAYHFKTQNIMRRASYGSEGSESDASDDGGYDSFEEEFDYKKMAMHIENDSSDQLQIPELQNFLKNPPLTLFNLKPSENGEVTFTANLQPFTQLIVIVVDQNSIAQKEVDLQQNPTEKRDLSLNKPLDDKKGYTESRTTTEILKHETHFIEDITSTEIQIIDDLKKVKGVLTELLQSSYGVGRVFNVLSPVFFKWLKMDKDQKSKEYYKSFSHELNIFIYFKDREYFNEIVRPFLTCKMEKTFVDYYLLEDYDTVISYMQINKFNKLNALEKCFLVSALMKKGMKDDAERITKSIKDQNDAAYYKDVTTENRIFDTVLNLNMLKIQSEKPDELAAGMALDMVYPQSTTTSAILHSQQYRGYRGRGSAQPRMMEERKQNYRSRDRKEQVYKEEEADSCRNNCLFDDDYCGDECEEDDDADYNYRYEKQKRTEQIKQTKLSFEEVQTTNEYMETHYYGQNNNQQSTGLIPMNAFWADYAKYLSTNSQQPFISSNFYKNTNSQAGALLTFALLDLPFEAESHGYKTNESRGVEIKTTGNIILFKKEVRDAPLALTNDILITHRYVPVDSSGENEQAIPDEFLVNKAYQCEVIMTNVSPMTKSFSILYQIPQGSLPLQMTKYMKSIPQTLSSYTTQKMFFYFYFPTVGNFIHFGSNASDDEKIIARANTNILKVVEKLSVAKKETFKDIVKGGSKEDVLEFLRTKNLFAYEKGFSFNDIYWMYKDKQFYNQVISILRSRQIYDETTWSYGFYHKEDESIIQEYLMTSRPYQLYSQINCMFNSQLVKFDKDAIEFKHLDYFPMINARAHQVGDLEQWTLNVNFKNAYEGLLRKIISLETLDVQLKMMLIYNLQLQDRISEAIELFNTVDINSEDLKGSLRIQYDYMKAYFDFFTGAEDNFKIARGIVRQYEDYPISSWRILFLEILDQLNELDGEVDENLDIDPETMTEETRKHKQKQSIKKEPKLDIEIQNENQKITIELANIKHLTVKFYIIDAEILFSRTPFLKENTEEFSYVKPCHVIDQEFGNPDLNSSVDTVTYLQTNQKFDLEIPEHLKNQNMVVEITGDGIQIFKTYYSTSIVVNVVEAYGELKVTDKQGQALSKVYVKVFSQNKGQSAHNAVFFKDGYTDIRGKFEYAQLSGDKLKQVEKFAILVLSDTHGSTIKECNPPKGICSSTGNVSEIMQQNKEERIFKRVENWKKK